MYLLIDIELKRSTMGVGDIKHLAKQELKTIIAPKEGGGKGAEMLRKGEFDELAKNKKILRSWKKTAKEHLLITKNSYSRYTSIVRCSIGSISRTVIALNMCTTSLRV